MKNIKLNRLNLFKKSSNSNKFDFSNDNIVIQQQQQQQQSYLINTSKFNFNEVNCASSPMASMMKKQHKSTSNMNKFRKVLSNKLKNMMQQNTPKKLSVKLNETIKSSLNDVKLLNFNYCQSPKFNSNKPIEYKRQVMNKIDVTTMMQFQEMTTFMLNNVVSTSTPISSQQRMRQLISSTATSNSTYKIKQPSFEDDDEEDEIIDYADEEYNESTASPMMYNYSQMDDSTQCDVNEPPKLIESTFNSSSLSNMSNDLIILQHKFTTTPYETKSTNNSNKRESHLAEKSWNSMVIKKFHENTNASFNDMPSWALGNQLNLALVNQLYYNPAGRGVFNANKLQQILLK